MESSVGFIGLGAMGTPVLRNIIEQIHSSSVRVHNRSIDKVDGFRLSLPAEQQARVSVAPRPLDTITGPSSVVFSIVANDAALEEIVTGEDGLLSPASVLGEGGVHVCFSTVAPTTTARMADLHAARGVSYIACPVFGRPEAAAARRLLVVAGGPASAVDRVLPYLAAIGQRVVRAGEQAQAASILKLTGNFMLLGLIELCGEAFALAESSGVVDRMTAHELLTGPQGLFASLPVLQGYGRMIAAHAYSPVGFTAVNGLKDARLITSTAAAGGVSLPIAHLMQGRLEGVVAALGQEGAAQVDWASVAKDIGKRQEQQP